VAEDPSNPPERLHRRIRVALPFRVTCWDGETNPSLDAACTYDISPQGARITNLRCVKEAGEIIAIERGRNKVFCRVVWVGDPHSEFRGQMGIQVLESERLMWEIERRDLDELYDPMLREDSQQRSLALGSGERRWRPRFQIEGPAELLKLGCNDLPIKAALKDLSEIGCLVTHAGPVSPGTNLHLFLNVGNYDLSLKGQVRHSAPETGLGIEFREIRKGDREALQFLLRKLAEQQLEASFEFEIDQ
jgi:PilZ domain